MNYYNWFLFVVVSGFVFLSCNTARTNCIKGYHADNGSCISDLFLLTDNPQVLDDDLLSAELLINAPSSISVNEQFPLKVWLENNNNTETVDVTEKAEIISFDESVISIDDNGSLKAHKKGLGFIRARLGRIWSEKFRIQVVDNTLTEARGLWVNRWAYRNKSDVERIIDKAYRTGFNQIYFQVRGTFDAYYESLLEPWAKRLSGKLGKNPGWDPLLVAIRAAHERGMELHAWINVFTFWEGRGKPVSSGEIKHKYQEHPEWLMEDKNKNAKSDDIGYVWASPASPQVRNHNVMVVRDIISKYDVDGIHLDRVRYPSENFGYEEQALKLYESAKTDFKESDFSDWRRNLITAQVRDIYAVIYETKPKVVLSAAVCGIYKDEWQWNSVTEGYVHWLQDWKSWADLEIIDVVIPMVYWSTKPDRDQPTDFETLVDSNTAMVQNRFVYIGSDLLAAQDAESQNVGLPRQLEKYSELETQLEYVRQTNAKGFVIYDYGTLERANYWDKLAAGPFRYPAKVPFIWWKELKTQPPALGKMLQTSSSSERGVFQPLR